MPLGLAAVIALAAAGTMTIVSTIRSEIRAVHTRFLFNQIRDIVTRNGLPTDRIALLVALRRADIDWNSCGIERDNLLDGWRRPVQVAIAEASLVIQSAGLDGHLGTDDDIVERIEKK